jgi:hypothetical protein
MRTRIALTRRYIGYIIFVAMLIVYLALAINTVIAVLQFPSP